MHSKTNRNKNNPLAKGLRMDSILMLPFTVKHKFLANISKLIYEHTNEQFQSAGMA